MFKPKWFILISLSLVFILLFTLSATASTKLEPARQVLHESNTALGTGFSYQGFLKGSGGTPVTATCSFKFTLYGSYDGDDPIGSYDEVTGISVSAGYFTATVNDYGEFGSDAFNGQARWLKVEVKCGAEGEYSALSPRQSLGTAPYAFSLAPGAVVQGARSDWILKLNNTPDNGGSPYGLHASTPFIALYGKATRTSGVAYGVYGTADSTQGIGVYGTAPVKGVAGYANNETGTSYGVFGSAYSVAGVGVKGEARKYGVFGEGITTSSYGVRGEVGTYSSIGVSGYASAPSSPTKGVEGWVDSSEGIGVYGIAITNTGTTYGIQGVSQSAAGYGVYGKNTAGGKAVAAEGPIWSSAESILVLSPHAMVSRGSSGITLTPLENGGVSIAVNTGVTGEKIVSLPVSTYATLFGSQVYIKAIQVCYDVGITDSTQYIDITQVIKNNSGESYGFYIVDYTERNSEARECYTVTDTTPYTAIDNSTWVQFNLQFDTEGGAITIYTVKLTLVESST